jgi:hypothetical protein
MPYLVIILSINVYAEAERPPTCVSKSYNYTGPYYSDSYQMPGKEGVQSCHKRKAIDAVKLGELHKANRELISLQIDKMLSDPNCKDVYDKVNMYREKLKKQKEKTEQGFKVVATYFEATKHLWDIQRQYAYAAAYNTACSAERNSESSFIDLDTINHILPSAAAKVTMVTKGNEFVDDCSDVKASGDEDLEGFIVSMKKAKGTEFIMLFEPYEIPDQVTLKTKTGAVIYDSGCIGSSGAADEDLNIKIPLSKLSSDKEVVVNILNNCSDSSKKKMGVWDLSIKCEQEITGLCGEPKRELAELLKIEVGYYKNFMDANATERHCFEHFDEDILKEMEKFGLFVMEGGTMSNGLCETFDVECDNQKAENAKNEKLFSHTVPMIPAVQIPRPEESPCDKQRPSLSESVLKLASWAICTTGRQKLGLD